MSDRRIDLAGVPSQSGLAVEEQLDLHLQLAQDLDSRVGRFPGAPNDYVARVKDLLLSVLLPSLDH